ncbi:hypothetical protein GCM10009623_24600 [Nocardioides aestuarii]|uniref:DUF222 domain-containing protein n=1 Tax=Nocardioides aestuarii TaxID=252231 RepID=A0ABW4TPF8_9ACTN
MFDMLTEDLDAAATLAAVEDQVVVRRAAEARDLALAARWADLHAADPQRSDLRGPRSWSGEDRLIEVGGDGTPMVQDLCLAELAIARRVHHHSARAVVADALDLRHRLPRWWRAVQELHLEPWVARKAAVLSRPLDMVRVMVVDAALPDDLAEVSPGRLLDIVRAKVIEADPERHARLLDEQLRRRYVTLSQTDEFGLRHLIARVKAGDAVWIDAMLERVADLLAPRFPEGTSRDVLRSEALGWLARPEDLVALLRGDEAPDPTRQAVMVVHLSEDAVGTESGLARVEDIGPVLTRQVQDWLGHTHVTVRPVVDLADQVAVDAYEHPASVRERVSLRTPVDAFPHANQVSSHLDLDHVEAYVSGAPGQTGDHNSQPLARTSHRAKTHLGYRVRQLRPGVYVWRTPHGLTRLVDHRGTTVLPHRSCDDLFDSHE